MCRADGVVLLLTKFCDPWLFDCQRITATLDEADMLSLTLEIEQNQPPPEQFRTRVAAFAELLTGMTQ